MKVSQLETVPPTADNTALVLVTYYPDEQVKARIQTLSTQFKKVFVVDNTPASQSTDSIYPIISIHLISNSINAGLGRALNQGCEAAKACKFEWVITLDQDSVLQAGFLQSQLACWSTSAFKPFLLGSNYISESRQESPARFPVGSYSRQCKTVITSGTLMHLGTWHQLGGFREDFFIDSLDHELCLRARAQGLKVARNGEIHMRHTIGTTRRGQKWLPFNHPPLRKYTSTRNTVRTILEYGLYEPLWALKKIAGILYEVASVVLLESSKKHKLQAMQAGITDGFKNRLGPPAMDFGDE